MRVFFGGNEFGEVFHAAAFVAISDEHRVTIVGDDDKWQPTCEFLNKIAPGSTEISKRQSGESIGYTANVFHKRRHANLSALVSSKLGPLLRPVPEGISDLGTTFVTQETSCFLWIRQSSSHEPKRNLNELAYGQLDCVLQKAGISPILVGDSAPFLVRDSSNLLDFFKDAPFKNDPLSQLQLLNHVCENTRIAFSIGMKSGAMDGLAFTRGLRTYYVSHPQHNARMNKVAKAFPAFSLIPVSYEDEFPKFSDTDLEGLYSRIC
jgi:hypothetical protein